MAFPFRLTPNSVHSSIMATALNQIFSSPIKKGELDFLRNRILSIQIEDAHTEFNLTLKNNSFIREASGSADIIITGNTYDFIELAIGREDHDTLFFNRRLRLEGDTELGLELKNFLDAQEILLPPVPPVIQKAGGKLMNFWEHWASFMN